MKVAKDEMCVVDVGSKSSYLDEVGRGCFGKSEREDLELTSECKRDREQPS